MESGKKVTSVSSSSSSFVDLFGPKDSSVPPSSPGLFSSVFGSSFTGLGENFSGSRVSKPPRNQNSASAETQDNRTWNNYGKSGSIQTKDRSASGQKETAEPFNFNSSIYYGGQDVYSPDIKSKNAQSAIKKVGGDNDSNGSNYNSESQGNWWQGSLYY